jgi:hypothetical protein
VFSLDLVNRWLVAEHGFRLGSITLDDCNSERIGLDKSLEFVIPTRMDASCPFHNNNNSMHRSDVVGKNKKKTHTETNVSMCVLQA